MIYFVRHGESEANAQKIFAGQRYDSLLTLKGRYQAKNTVKEIISKGIKINRIVSSPLKRTKETAKIIAKELGLNIKIDKRITEYDIGILSGTPFKKISNALLNKTEGSENIQAFEERVLSCIKELNDDKVNTLVVSHEGVAGILETVRKKMSPNLFYKIKIYPNGSITKIDWIK